MPNAYKDFPVSSGHNITKGGVFLLADPVISRRVCDQLHGKVFANNGSNEMISIVRGEISKPIENIAKSLPMQIKNKLSERWTNLSEKSKAISIQKIRKPAQVAKTFIRQNGMLYHFLTNFNNECLKKGGRTTDIKLDAIVGIESVKDENIEKYPSHCFGYFGGSKSNDAEPVYENCLRETTEESNIVFDESVLDLDYQMYLRRRHRCEFVPIVVDTQFRDTDLYSRVLVVLLGEDVVLKEEGVLFKAKRKI